jgi:hypothetical protein
MLLMRSLELQVGNISAIALSNNASLTFSAGRTVFKAAQGISETSGTHQDATTDQSHRAATDTVRNAACPGRGME